MSRLRVLVEMDGKTVVDREIESDDCNVEVKNHVADMGYGDVYKDFRPTGHHSVLITWVDRAQELAFWAPKPTNRRTWKP